MEIINPFRLTPEPARLPLQNKLLLRNLGLRFWIASSARRMLLRIERQASLDEAFEQRMGLVRFALKFWVVLAADEIGMIAEFDQFGQCPVWRGAGNYEAFLVHSVAILHVELVAMAVSLHHIGRAVNLFSQRSFHNLRWPRPQPHARAFAVNFFALLFE